MPYDQKQDPVLDISGSRPRPKPHKAPPPPPKDFVAGPKDDSIVRLAYDLNEAKAKRQRENKQSRGRQAGYSKADCENIVKEP